MSDEKGPWEDVKEFDDLESLGPSPSPDPSPERGRTETVPATEPQIEAMTNLAKASRQLLERAKIAGLQGWALDQLQKYVDIWASATATNDRATSPIPPADTAPDRSKKIPDPTGLRYRSKVIADLTAENARLREALERLADHCKVFCVAQDETCRPYLNARAALAPPQQESRNE